MEHNVNIIIAVATAAAAIALFVIVSIGAKRISTRSIAFGAVALALSVGLSYVRLWRMPQGGSVTLASMLPVMLYAYIFGPKKGLFIGLAYAGLQSLQDLYFVHPIQFILDYPLAFASLGLVGLFRAVPEMKIKKGGGYPLGFMIGMVAVCLIRFVCHTLSGVFFFAEYAGAQNVWVYSLGYNSFVFVECAICMFAGGLLIGNRAAKQFLFRPGA